MLLIFLLLESFSWFYFNYRSETSEKRRFGDSFELKNIVSHFCLRTNPLRYYRTGYHNRTPSRVLEAGDTGTTWKKNPGSLKYLGSIAVYRWTIDNPQVREWSKWVSLFRERTPKRNICQKRARALCSVRISTSAFFASWNRWSHLSFSGKEDGNRFVIYGAWF